MSHSVESVVVQHPVYGFYGKLPAVGDFVQRNLATSTIAAVDAWLQQGMYLLGQQGQTFQDSYMVSHVGFFVVPAPLWAAQPVAGFIMPSVDRVGRLFPLVFLQSIEADQAADLGALSSELEHTSSIAITALQQRLVPDELYQRLLATAASPGTADAVTPLDTGACEAFSMEGTQSLWWRPGDLRDRRVRVFDTADVRSIFSYLYL